MKPGVSKKASIISVVMATLNCVDSLPNALDSLRIQKSNEFECIIVDGGSTDGTCEVINSYPDIIQHWVSEVDDGIADAFNKGVNLAAGDIIYFLGADDVLHDEYVLSDVVAALPKLTRPYFFYGDLFYSYQNEKKLIKQNFAVRKFRRYNCIPHQAMFLEKSFFDKYGPFDTQYRYAMDYEHISRFISSHRPQYFQRIIAEMRRYGRSSEILPAHAEMDRIRLGKGYATRNTIVFDHFVLRMKMLFARALRINW